MRLLQLRTLWGVTEECDGEAARSPKDVRTLEGAVSKLKGLGYDGIELPFKLLLFYGADRVKKLLVDNGMQCTVLVMTDNVLAPGAGILWGGPYTRDLCGGGAPFTAPCAGGSKEQELDPDLVVGNHLAVWKEQVSELKALRDGGLPLHVIVSHSGRDFFTPAQRDRFFTEALAHEEALNAGVADPLKVCHETHRSRILYSPWVCREALEKFGPRGLKLCADYSHWVAVCESADAHVEAAVEACAPFVHHTHCRVGHEQGAQVPDPREPEWASHVEMHERWWDGIWRAAEARGDRVASMIPEHGPPPYQACAFKKAGGEPLALIWDVNHWVHLRRKKSWEERGGAAAGEEGGAKRRKV